MEVQAESVYKERCINPIRPFSHMARLSLGAVGSQVLFGGSTKTICETHDLCCSLWVKLARLRLTFSSRPNEGSEHALCWERQRGEKDRSPIFCLNPSR